MRISVVRRRGNSHAATSTRPPHPASTFVTTAKRPSYRDGTGREKHNFRKIETGKFSRTGWTRVTVLKLLGKSSVLREAFSRRLREDRPLRREKRRIRAGAICPSGWRDAGRIAQLPQGARGRREAADPSSPARHVARARCDWHQTGLKIGRPRDTECVLCHGPDCAHAALKSQADEQLSVVASDNLASTIADTPQPQVQHGSWFFTTGVTHVTSHWGRLLNMFLFTLVMLFLSIVILFVSNFPDAPLRPCGTDQFCGRSDERHSQADYRKYVFLERAILATLPIPLAAGGILVWRRRRRAQYVQRLLAKQRDLSPAVEELRYESAWKNREQRKKAAVVLGLAAIATVVSRNMTGFPPALLPVALVASAVVAFIWFGRFACPRCREQFASWRSPGRCRCCGLPHGATFKESLGELERPTADRREGTLNRRRP